MSCFSSRKIDTYSWVLKLVVSTIRRKKIDHGIFLCVQGGVECDSVEKPFFLLILHRSVLIFKKHEFFLRSWEDIRRNVSFNYLWSDDHKQNE